MRTPTVLAGEERLATQHLGENATHGPHINGLGILLECQHDLRRAVPTSGDVFGHETGVVLLRSRRTSQTKIANLEITVGVQKEVRRLEITVQNVGGVHSLEGAEGLVDEILAVVVREVLRADNAMHIRLHEFLSVVNIRTSRHKPVYKPESGKPR